MNKILVLIIILAFPPAAFAQEENYGDIVRYKYNPIEDWWKFRPSNSTIKYNPLTNEWTYVYPGETLRFNPEEETWEYELPEKQLGYDLLKEKWFFMKMYQRKK